VSEAREAAHGLLAAVERGRRLDVAFEEAAPTLSPRDRAWVQEVAYGTVRLRGRLDHLLDLHLDRGLESVPRPLLLLLRLGAYQLLYTGSAPGYAAVSQTVDQARRVGGNKGAGLANAVLRALDRAGGGVERFPSFDADPVAHLTTWGSHPRWLVERWVDRFGPSGTREVVAANNRIPYLYLRAVTVSAEEAAARLARAGIRTLPGPAGSRTLRLPAGTSPSEVVVRVPGIIQDPAASLVAEYAGAGPGERVADLCAAPGGKGIVLAGKGALVIGADASRVRLLRMADSLRRLSLPARLVVARAEDPPLREADLVLLDVPCSGTGTLGRHPDGRWRLGPGDPARLAAVQARILEGAAPVVRPGGCLIYATCSLESEENEQQVERFLKRNPEFVLEPLRTPEGPGERAPYLWILPDADGTDGAFAARLRRLG
jgi:16S rRNA (cytosine967-C5)-methyltransferase